MEYKKIEKNFFLTWERGGGVPLTLDSSAINDTIEKRSYKPWYSQKFPWLTYQPNLGGFCSICHNYWKPGVPLFREMKKKTK